MKRIVSYFALFFFIIGVDQITKFIALSCITCSRDVFSWLALDLLFNRGVSWGFFHSQSTTIFVLVSVVIAFILLLLIGNAYQWFSRGWPICGHILITAGALSNLIDRVRMHAVIDFISIHYGDIFWPAFNVADAAIFCGACILFYVQWQRT
jgi:signal peptidase II